MRNILVLDTSTDRAALGLATGAGTVHVAVLEAQRRHGRDLIPRIKAILGEARLNCLEIEVIGVGVGPGSYTGLRVGVTAAKTLAYATGAALVGLDSLHAIALNAPAEALSISVIADAQRGDIYLADFFREAPGCPLVPAGTSHLEPLSSWVSRIERDLVVMGPGLDSPRVRGALPPGFRTPDPSCNYPQGCQLLTLAREACASARWENSWLLEPRYLRRSAAEDQWDVRGKAPHPA